jgi:hypothetical protein
MLIDVGGDSSCEMLLELVIAPVNKRWAYVMLLLHYHAVLETYLLTNLENRSGHPYLALNANNNPQQLVAPSRYSPSILSGLVCVKQRKFKPVGSLRRAFFVPCTEYPTNNLTYVYHN